MVGFNYRRLPATELARRLVANGRLGEVRHVRAAYLQDWLHDESAPASWRLDAASAGSGALGDLGSHVVDLAQHLTGSTLGSVTALAHTFVPVRPSPEGDRAVTVDDAVLFAGRFGNGALGAFEATRMATGRRNALRIEVNGSLGSVAFDLERLNELEVYDGADGDTAGFRRVLVTDADHPWLSGWWPPGHTLGWEHTFVHQAKDLLDAIASGTPASPSFHDGLQVQRVLAAVQDSAATGALVDVGA
jgi:predicted dehydrogenase